MLQALGPGLQGAPFLRRNCGSDSKQGYDARADSGLYEYPKVSHVLRSVRGPKLSACHQNKFLARRSLANVSESLGHDRRKENKRRHFRDNSTALENSGITHIM